MKTVPIDDRLESMLIYAERYCLGRATYAVSDFCTYAKPLLPYMSNKTLAVLNDDFLSRTKAGESFGMKQDEDIWGNFWNAVIDEIKRRQGAWNNDGTTGLR